MITQEIKVNFGYAEEKKRKEKKENALHSSYYCRRSSLEKQCISMDRQTIKEEKNGTNLVRKKKKRTERKEVDRKSGKTNRQIVEERKKT